MTLELQLATMSRQGGRKYNEDACGHWHSAGRLCCVLADGAGGHGGGDKASKLAVENILGLFAAESGASAPLIERLIIDTNRAIIRHRADDRSVQNMYSTAVALVVDLDAATVAWGHCGDSRLYLFRQGRIVVRTRDHSLVQSLVDGGMLAVEEMRSHPQRSELLSALGVAEEDLQVALSEEGWRLQPGDVVMLCTDGLWEYVDDPELESTLAEAPDARAWMKALEQLVLQAAVRKPRHDNFTAMTIWVR
ncbi:MAG: protein phosphatase 2C domain-containing protein [Caldimonas sp.]